MSDVKGIMEISQFGQNSRFNGALTLAFFKNLCSVDFLDDEDDADDSDPTLYKLKERYLRVKFDLADGWIRVHGRKLVLSGINNSNGVDVEIHIGDWVSVETIMMEEYGHHGKSLFYHRPE